MAVTEEKKTAHLVFSSLARYLKLNGCSVRDLATYCAVSEQTFRQYLANPETTEFRAPTVEAIDELIQEAAKIENLSVASTKDTVYRVVFTRVNLPYIDFKTAVGAQDFIDSSRFKVARPDIEVVGGGDLPNMTEDEMLRFRWRNVAFRGSVPRQVLASVAGLSIYEVGLVGRELTFGVTPDAGQVEAAEAANRQAEKLRTRKLMKRFA
jgi:hypothetical protein